MSQTQIANQGAKTALARSASARGNGSVVKRLFLVSSLIEKQQYATLIHEVRKRHVPVEAMAEALRQLGAPALKRALCTSIGKPYNTSMLHEVFRCGQQSVMMWINEHLRELLIMPEASDTRTTPVHLAAQRSVDDLFPDANFLVKFASQLELSELSVRDAYGYTPLHYIGMYTHQSAYEVVENRFPHLCNIVAQDGSTPAALFAARLRHDLFEVTIENKRLQSNDESMREKEELFSQMQSAVAQREKLIKEQQARIEQLTRERATLQRGESELERQSNAHKAELDALKSKCRRAQQEAEAAQDRLDDALDKLAAHEAKIEALEEEIDGCQAELTLNRNELTSKEKEHERLEHSIEQLRAERNAAQSALTDDGDAVSDKIAQRNADLLKQINKLEKEIDDLSTQCDMTEREKKRIALENQRIEDARATALQTLRENVSEKLSLQERVGSAQKLCADLELKLDAANERVRSTERDIEQLREELRRTREQQKTIETDYKLQLTALAAEREALEAQLVDARNAARHAEERAQHEITRVRDEMLRLSQRTVEADKRAKELQEEMVAAKRNAIDDVERVRSATQKQIEHLRAEVAKHRTNAHDVALSGGTRAEVQVAQERFERAAQEAQASEARLRAQLSDTERQLADLLMERAKLAEASETECGQLRAQLVQAEQRMQDLEKSANENFASAAEWERYTKEVQERHDVSVRELEAKLQTTEDMLRRTRKELEQERALAAAGPPPPLPLDLIAVGPAADSAKNSPRVVSPRGDRAGGADAKAASSARPASNGSVLKRAFTIRKTSDVSAEPDQSLEESVSHKRVGEREESAEVQLLRKNARLNSKFFSDAFMLVRTGDYEKLTQLFNFGFNPNTRCTDALSQGQTMLEVLVRAAAETQATCERRGKEAEEQLDRMTKTAPLLIQRGGDWDELDEFVRANEHTLPDKLCYVLRRRDDASPFCKALIKGRAVEAEMHLSTVENLNRVPAEYEKDGFTYLHIAVKQEAARLVQAMLLTGRVDVSAKDRNDRTPLHLLLQLCTDQPTRLEIAKYLLAAGAKPKQPCLYQTLINTSRERIEALQRSSGKSPKTSGVRKLATLLKPATNKPGSFKDLQAQVNLSATEYGTPLAMARSLNDIELVECMTNRRYLLPSTDKNDSDAGVPLLQEYVISCVTLHADMEELLATGVISETDELYEIYKRYRYVFQCFNPNFGGAEGYDSVRHALYEAAGIDKHDTSGNYDERRSDALKKMIARDEWSIKRAIDESKQAEAKRMQKSSKIGTVHATKSLAAGIGVQLMQCTHAAAERWFDVSTMIERQARAMYPRAVLLAIKHFVELDRVDALEYMLHRRDKLFGDVDVNTIVDEKRQFTPIELAAHLGVVGVLEWLMDRQRGRIDQIGAFGRTLVSIASAAGQPVAIVAIDKFKFENKISLEQHPNSAHYGILSNEMQNTVLHQCAILCRGDLMRFCIDQVRYQLTKLNKHGHAPLKTARDTYEFRKQLFKSEAEERSARECIELIRERVEHGGDSGQTSTSSTQTPRAFGDDAAPPPLKPPPPLLGLSVVIGTPQDQMYVTENTAIPSPTTHEHSTADDDDDYYDYGLDDDDEDAASGDQKSGEKTDTNGDPALPDSARERRRRHKHHHKSHSSSSSTHKSSSGSRRKHKSKEKQ